MSKLTFPLPPDYRDWPRGHKRLWLQAAIRVSQRWRERGVVEAAARPSFVAYQAEKIRFYQQLLERL